MLRPADLVTSIARETQMHLTRIRIKCTMYGVLSVAKLTPGQEGYYERSVAAGIDDYYAGRGESPGIWTGTGAAAIGLEGVVEDGQLGTLIRGDHPHTGDRLRRRQRARTGAARFPFAGRMPRSAPGNCLADNASSRAPRPRTARCRHRAAA